MDGDYVVRLTASSKKGGSKSDEVNIKVDSGLAIAPRDLTFIDDIGPLMSGSCITCHASGVQDGVPVWWVADASQPIPPPTSPTDTPALGFYEQVMARVNLEMIEDSLLLKKPSGLHHFGDQRPGFNSSLAVGSSSRANFDLFVNWISEGAPCGRIGEAVTAECVR
jgi:hypothetical protein